MRVIFQFGTVTVFFGSFLLFMVQPMLGRTLLPVFGGSESVWCLCLASYQTLLLAGYAYAHRISWSPRLRVAHVALAAVSALWLLVVAVCRPAWLAWLGAGNAQALEVLAGVALFVGLPYVTLSAGSTVVQAWLAMQARGSPADSSRNVYSLYAVSNLGSLLGLLSYPFVLEPFVSLTAQWYGFAVAMALYALLLARAAFRAGRGSAEPEPALRASEETVRREGSNMGLALLLPGVSAFLLNAVTAHLLVDVMPMPLVWVVLLAAFLLSYVVGFSSLGACGRGAWCAGAALALIGAAVARGMWGVGSFFPNAVACVAVLFLVGVVLHGWLFEVRPEPTRLTRYYLFVALGGAAGGLLAALAAPLVFRSVAEYPLALFACAVLTAWRAPKPAFLRSPRAAATVALLCGLAWLTLAQFTARHTSSKTLFRDRNFYGCIAVTQTYERLGEDRHVFPIHYLWCGQTTHGIQIRSADAETRNTATAYYAATGGGIAFLAHPKYQAGEPMKVGIVGLGAGTLACYGRPNDLFRFYEINPQVVKVATDPQLFSFLPDAKMPIDLVPGDARRMLEKERAAHDPLYDLLVVDAYSGDAVPYHLSTREAFRLYFDRLSEDGMLAVHVSNWHIDLLPLCKAMATDLGVCAYGVVSGAQDGLTSGAIWVFMTRRPMAYRYPSKEGVSEIVWSDIREMAVPTDEKGSLVSLIRR